MKHLIILLIAVSIAAHANAGWFDKPKPDPVERDRRIELQTRLDQADHKLNEQQQLITRWQMATGSLVITCVVLLVVGTALGSKARKDGN